MIGGVPHVETNPNAEWALQGLTAAMPAENHMQGNTRSGPGWRRVWGGSFFLGRVAREPLGSNPFKGGSAFQTPRSAKGHSRARWDFHLT